MNDRYINQNSEQNIEDLARTRLWAPERALIASGNRVRVSLQTPLLATRFAYDELTQLFTEVENTNGTVTYNPDRDSVSLEIGTASGDKIYRSTNPFFHYTAYQEMHFGAGMVMPAFQSGQRCRTGAFYEDNGAYFERDENGNQNIVRRSKASGSVVNEVVPKLDWNIDVMDGSGHPQRNPSGIDLDDEKIQMVKVGFEWYGAGDAWVGFKINGVIYKCHAFYAGNNLTEPIFGEPTLPVRYEIENVSTVSSIASVETFGASASSEGPSAITRGFSFSADNERIPVSVNNTLTRVLTIRPKATFKSKTNRSKIIPLGVSLLTVSENVYFKVVRDAPYTNTPSWINVDSNSSVEYSVDATGTSGGRKRDSDYVIGGGNGSNLVSGNTNVSYADRFPLVIAADGTLGNVNLTVMAQTLPDTTSSDVVATIRWIEIQ